MSMKGNYGEALSLIPKKSVPNYFESKYQLKQAASLFSLAPKFTTSSANKAKSGTGRGPAAI